MRRKEPATVLHLTPNIHEIPKTQLNKNQHFTFCFSIIRLTAFHHHQILSSPSNVPPRFLILQTQNIQPNYIVLSSITLSLDFHVPKFVSYLSQKKGSLPITAGSAGICKAIPSPFSTAGSSVAKRNIRMTSILTPEIAPQTNKNHSLYYHQSGYWKHDWEARPTSRKTLDILVCSTWTSYNQDLANTNERIFFG